MASYFYLANISYSIMQRKLKEVTEMMYFMNGKFVVDFNAIGEFITNVYESSAEFLAENAVYAIIGISGFMVGVIWHAYMDWKEKKEQKRIEEKYQTSNI